MNPSSHQKKKRRSEVEKCPLPVDMDAPERVKKKKKVQREDAVSALLSDADGATGSQKKNMKKRKEQQQVVTVETSEMEKKKKKDKNGLIEEGVSTVTTDHNHTGTNKSGMKKKKKGGSVVEGLSQEGEKKRKRKRESGGEMETTGEGKKRKRKASVEEVQSFPKLKELMEFIPDIKNKSVVQINTLLRYDLHRFKYFKQQGVALRTGRCTQQENQQIRDNVSNFLALTGIGSATELLFPKRCKDKMAEIKRLKVQYRFMERIAEGIPRTCQTVYGRAKKMFDERNYMGRFSKEELCSLEKLQSLYAPGHGPWSPDEKSRLKKALKDHLEVLVHHNSDGPSLSQDQLSTNLPWKKIGQSVGTRSWTQCRIKWFSILKVKLTSGVSTFSRGPEGLESKIQLIHSLYNMRVEDVADIDWDEVAQTIGNVSNTCVQKTFHRMKVSRVPHWTGLSYGEIIDFLQLKVAPTLKKKLNRLKRESRREEAQGGRTFTLSDVFATHDEDDDYMELDNSQLTTGQSGHG
ncbi:transcription termination factor 1-like isoform X2 [Pseudoliparis swirei]|uniref:transcription termination factor 1-like isoform X2 n=1 Tax=Pseudoliparis swirei TaxID=2059687 RepID=UPI0024BDF9EF|nr:transcription termination factor 1-like isoform X2 [Pseudoliparis swirei]